MNQFRCETAILRDVSYSLASEALRMGGDFSVDIEKALKQHQDLIDVLRNKIGVKVMSLSKDEGLPDCVFVEDIAVVIGNKALVTKPGHPSRRPERKEMEKALKSFPTLEIGYMEQLDDTATLDGGDVLYTGQEIFVGLSTRTNEAGFKVLRDFFAPISATSISVTDDLHLKTGCSSAGPGRIPVALNETSKKVVEQMKRLAVGKYEFMEISGESRYSNCIYLEHGKKSFIICCPQAFDQLSRIEGVTVIPLDLSEFAKVDGCLTCSVLSVGV